jgi:peptidoglycan/xylan/chitin deacetylase (PgdA/CDA1 family)
MNFPALIPSWIKFIYPSMVWKEAADEKVLYITFDDGPHPRITPLVLEMLNEYKAKATFFCIGDRVKRYPEIAQKILAEGHAIGNHTQHHLNGWSTPDDVYIHDVEQATQLIPSKLFRPPYGRMRRSQIRRLLEKNFKIIMWSVLSADYDASLNKEQCALRVLNNIDHGNIVLFHDSEKAEDRLLYALKALLDRASNKGYVFKKIEEVG